MNANDIVERLRSVAWGHRHTNADVARFLEGFSDAPYRSEQTRSLVGGLCPHAPRWYSTASVEGLLTESHDKYRIDKFGRGGFLYAVSFAGYLISILSSAYHRYTSDVHQSALAAVVSFRDQPGF